MIAPTKLCTISVNITSWCHDTEMIHPAHRHLPRGDGDEVGVSFNGASLSLKTATKILLSNGYCTFRL